MILGKNIYLKAIGIFVDFDFMFKLKTRVENTEAFLLTSQKYS